MEHFKTGYFEGIPQPHMQGIKVMLAGRTAFLPNRSTPLVVQKLTLRQIAEIPRDKYAVAVIEPERATVDILASRVGAVAASTYRRSRYPRNIARHRLQSRYNRRSAKGDGTQEFITVISLLQQVQRHVETIYYENRELSRNDKKDPSPGIDIFLTPIDAGKMSDCIKRIVLDVFGDSDKGKIYNREIKLVEFCLLMHYYFIRIKVLKNTSRQPFCEYLEKYVFADQSRFTAKTFNNYANEDKYIKAEPDFTNAKKRRSSILPWTARTTDYPKTLHMRYISKGMSDTPCTCALKPLIFEFSDSADALV